MKPREHTRLLILLLLVILSLFRPFGKSLPFLRADGFIQYLPVSSLLSTTNGNNHHHVKVSNQTVWILITGVLGDLELESKIQHVIRPLRALRYDVHVLVLLQSDLTPNHFPPFREPYSYMFPSSFKEGTNTASLRPPASEFYESPLGNQPAVVKNENIARLIQKRSRHFENANDILQELGNLSSTTILIQEPLVNLPMNIDYIRALALRDGRNSEGLMNRNALGRIIWRAVNDFRQLKLWHQAWEIISQQNGNSTSVNHDSLKGTIIKLGEDSIVKGTHDIGSVIAFVQSQSRLVAIQCETARGHRNDQMEIFPAAMAQPTLVLPYTSLFQAGRFSLEDPESNCTDPFSSYLLSLYQSRKIAVSVASKGNPNSLSPFSVTSPTNEDDMARDDRVMEPSPFQFPLSTRSLGQAKQHNHTNETKSKKPRIFVCVTGQLQRLELKNKFRTLIQPMKKAGYGVDLALVLSEGQAIHQMRKVRKKETHAAFSSQKEILDFINNQAHVLNPQNVTYVKPVNHPVNPQYLYHLAVLKRSGAMKKRQTFHSKWSNVEEALQRTLRNTIMMESYTRCWKWAHQSGESYRWYVRIRDDVGFKRNLNPKKTYDKIKGKASLITSSANTNGGINDRMAIVGPKAAECYFNLPYIKLFDGSSLDNAMMNSESFFNRQYWRNNCGDRKEISDKPRKMINGGFID